MRPTLSVAIPTERGEPAVPRELNPAYHQLPVLDRYEVDGNGCWNWLGRIDPTGYGRCKVNGHSTVMAHRVMYEHHVGPIPQGLDLDHLCRNRACVNPAHLEPVTRGENTRRGTHTKLTWEQANEIRQVMDDLCAKYGVRPRTLAAIAERRIWKPEDEKGGDA